MNVDDIYKVRPIKEKIENREYDIEKMVKTDGDWCPNYPNDEIKVLMCLYDEYDEEIVVKVMAWGMDDTGVELEYTTSKDGFGYFMADRVWNQWKERIYDRIPQVVGVEWFLDRGFLYV